MIKKILPFFSFLLVANLVFCQSNVSDSIFVSKKFLRFSYTYHGRSYDDLQYFEPIIYDTQNFNLTELYESRKKDGMWAFVTSFTGGSLITLGTASAIHENSLNLKSGSYLGIGIVSVIVSGYLTKRYNKKSHEIVDKYNTSLNE